jgi:hypothetical protein
MSWDTKHISDRIRATNFVSGKWLDSNQIDLYHFESDAPGENTIRISKRVAARTGRPPSSEIALYLCPVNSAAAPKVVVKVAEPSIYGGHSSWTGGWITGNTSSIRFNTDPIRFSAGSGYIGNTVYSGSVSAFGTTRSTLHTGNTIQAQPAQQAVGQNNLIAPIVPQEQQAPTPVAVAPVAPVDPDPAPAGITDEVLRRAEQIISRWNNNYLRRR